MHDVVKPLLSDKHCRLAVHPDIGPQYLQAEIGLDRDLEIFLELARGYRARAEQVGQPCPA